MIHKILMADDEPDILSAFAELLRAHGFDVVEASNSEEFEQALKLYNPDLIILDICMKGEAGPDLYDRVMQLKSPKTPVAFVSGLVDTRSESPLVKGRQVAMYAKPLNTEKLVQDIRAAFSDSIAA